jgi:hypothetical protein
MLLGSDRDSGPGYSYQNETHTPGALFSNVLRNLALQMPQLPAVTLATQQAAEKIDAALGLDPSDPRLTTYAPYFFIPPYQDETECANPVHLFAIALSFGLLVALRGRFSGNLQFLAVSVVAGALIFCFVLKWQPFHSRLHLPLLLLAVPVVAVVFDTLRFRLLTLLFVALMLASACNPLLFGRNHPLFGEYSIFTMTPAQQRYFVRSDIRDEYANALRLFRESHFQSIGVVSPPDNSGWEYPLFDPDHIDQGVPWRVEQVRVQNCYAPMETDIVPDIVVVLWPSQEKIFTVHGNDYHLTLPGKYGISVYLK